MKRGVAIVAEIGVLQALRVVFDDAFDEGEVVEMDGSAEADGDVDPEACQNGVKGRSTV